MVRGERLGNGASQRRELRLAQRGHRLAHPRNQRELDRRHAPVDELRHTKERIQHLAAVEKREQLARPLLALAHEAELRVALKAEQSPARAAAVRTHCSDGFRRLGGDRQRRRRLIHARRGDHFGGARLGSPLFPLSRRHQRDALIEPAVARLARRALQQPVDRLARHFLRRSGSVELRVERREHLAHRPFVRRDLGATHHGHAGAYKRHEHELYRRRGIDDLCRADKSVEGAFTVE
mmetsp:Transcript_17273/g.39479  ORF Transcript_17273/g.39479 Transcript_17273/m.39479 type:complete len:237 (+) Transcript_17273:405-1115(+)